MWAKLRVEYREAGMEESAIAAMYEFDCEVFRKNRTYGIHNTYFSTVMPDGEEVADDRSFFIFQLTHPREMRQQIQPKKYVVDL